ncbi:MAG: hypothetical protein L0Y58_23820 [Verrucomicrobia subdivision 3 bacterium]|nr:hypothetical protein [Limisphaerales bacterium]
MAITIKALGANIIAAIGTTALYSVPAGKSAVVKNIRLVNNHATLATPVLNLYAKPASGTARRIYNKDFTIPAKEDFIIEDVVTLGTLDKIELNLATAPPSEGIAFMVSGVERD